MPRTATWRQDAPLVQLNGYSAHAGEALRPQVIHDGPQVSRTMLCVRPDQLGLRADAEGLAGLAAIPVHLVDIRAGFARVSRSVT